MKNKDVRKARKIACKLAKTAEIPVKPLTASKPRMPDVVRKFVHAPESEGALAECVKAIAREVFA